MAESVPFIGPRSVQRATARPVLFRSRSYPSDVKALGIICDKAAIRYTIVDDATAPEDAELAVPASRTDRGDQLNWLLQEFEDLLRRAAPVAGFVKKSGGGQFASSPERHEVEAVVQLAAHRASMACEMKTTEQIRAAAGAPKGKGAYDELLARDDVAARPSKDKRERYLYAVTALQAHRGR